ncbi:Importin subunit beta-2 [Ceratobasidium theobromae]|uniref:Importin subunit beta-2 n=1 Tax=Ceratobasidium theobromae TaxID=1582974 RepID=A0A5N5QQ47_9AGAM|nr:Importin subunit beta-2 [Ceratobasidium theobromae]
MSWTPQAGGLAEVLQVLRDSTQNQSAEVQKAMTLRLQSFMQVADYPCYLAHILALVPDDERVRTVAGLVLKNAAKGIGSAQPAVVAYVKETVLRAYGDPSAMVRNAAAQVIVVVLGQLEPANWPEALTVLLHGLDGDAGDQEAAFGVLEKCCEDYPRKLETEIHGTRPTDILIPRFLGLADADSPKIRTLALTCLSHFIPVASPALWAHVDALLAMLFKHASDPAADVRRQVCQALVLLLAARPDKLLPALGSVADYMLFSTQDKDENVALEACEFWLTFAEDPDLGDHLRPLLPRVAPVLLSCMVYGDDDLIWLAGDDDDADVPDRPQDIKPKHFGAKAHGLESESDPKQPPPDDDDDDYDDFDDDDDLSTEWNLRKCAAAAIDVIAVRFGPDLLQILMPHLRDRLWSQDWIQRESGILALGAMAEGCIEAIEPYLPELIPFLINTLNDPKPLVRSITCWTLGRYANWCTSSSTQDHREKYFVPAMEGVSRILCIDPAHPPQLLRMVLDNNKRVQEAGCSAFATLEEDAGPALEPYLDPILRNLVFAFQKYQAKNLLILYDAIGTLADAVGSALNRKDVLDVLMPPLVERWGRLANDDEDLIPLLECLSSVTVACATGFLPYAEPVFRRCVEIVHGSLLQYQAFQQQPDTRAEPDKVFLIVALDLLSGLTQGLGAQIIPLVQASQPPLLQLLAVCLKHPDPPVRQSGYALVGDMSISCFSVLRPVIPQIMPELIEQIMPEPKMEFVSACNNAAWSVGEVALHYGADPEFGQWVAPLIQRLIPILLSPKSPKSLTENAAVTIGRLALVQPDMVSPHLELFAQPWCQALSEIKDNDEKDSAFRGFCGLIERNPSGIAKAFVFFCNAVVRWTAPSQELNELFSKQMSGAQWDAQMAAFPEGIQERLKQRYQL